MHYQTHPVYAGEPQRSQSQRTVENVMNPESWGNASSINPSYNLYPSNSGGVGGACNAELPNPYAGYPPVYLSPPQSSGSYSGYPFPPLPHQACPDENPDRTHKCRWCNRVFAHESSKCRHEKEHFNTFPCPEPGCEIVSSRKDSLKRHLRLIHGGTEGSNQGSSSRDNGRGTSGGMLNV